MRDELPRVYELFIFSDYLTALYLNYTDFRYTAVVRTHARSFNINNREYSVKNGISGCALVFFGFCGQILC